MRSLGLVLLAFAACTSEDERLAVWADRELAKLIEPLEDYRSQHGCYPQALCGPRESVVNREYASYSKLPECDGLPVPNPNLGALKYAEVDFDDYALGVIVRYKSVGASWRDLGIATSARGPVTDPPFFRQARLRGAHGRWTFWDLARDQDEPPDPITALRNAETSVRAAAVSALGRGEAPYATGPLLDAFGAERDAAVRARIVWALGRVSDGTALAVLRALAEDPDADAELRSRAAWAIEQIRLRAHRRR